MRTKQKRTYKDRKQDGIGERKRKEGREGGREGLKEGESEGGRRKEGCQHFPGLLNLILYMTHGRNCCNPLRDYWEMEITT